MSSPLERIRTSIDAEFATCSERVARLLADAVALSEREVLAAGEGVSLVKREAREHLEALRDVTRAFESRDGHDRGSLGTAVSVQSDTMNDLLSKLRSGQSDQRDATAAVAEAAERIDAFVSVIGDIATGLRVLTLNARIEAARRGAEGAAFATIADSMRSLATDVQRANEGIGKLSSELMGLSRHAREVEGKMDILMTDAQKRMAENVQRLLTSYDEAERASAIVARTGAQRAERMVELTNGILSHLQFQDRMAQTMAEANRNIDRTRQVATELMSRAETEDIDVITEEIERRFGTASVRISGESELDSSDREMESGVVTLF
jgi:methyl-accepting chemotaxis protein